jgi:hypothetical protein
MQTQTQTFDMTHFRAEVAAIKVLAIKEYVQSVKGEELAIHRLAFAIAIAEFCQKNAALLMIVFHSSFADARVGRDLNEIDQWLSQVNHCRANPELLLQSHAVSPLKKLADLTNLIAYENYTQQGIRSISLCNRMVEALGIVIARSVEWSEADICEIMAIALYHCSEAKATLF